MLAVLKWCVSAKGSKDNKYKKKKKKKKTPACQGWKCGTWEGERKKNVKKISHQNNSFRKKKKGKELVDYEY